MTDWFQSVMRTMATAAAQTGCPGAPHAITMRGMAAELLVEGMSAPVVLPPVLSLGRGADNAMVVKDAMASRHHAVILQRGAGDYQLTDLGSRNGTFVNGRRLIAPHTLADGDVIEIGEARMTVVLQGEHLPAPSIFDEPEATSTLHRAMQGSILVTDIRGFTTLSEKLPAADVARLLGRWFSDAGRLVEELNGTVDKVIGDALLAYWPRVRKGPHDVTEALTAARELIARAVRHQETLSEAHPGMNFKIGCGIHCGTVAVGNIGHRGAHDFTIIGDAVNTTFRIEGLCKVLGREVLVSDMICEAGGDHFAFDDMGTHEIRGKAEPMHIFALRLSGPEHRSV